MADQFEFDSVFQFMTRHPPFPWQQALYKEFVEKRIRRSYDIPTGLGKTAIIAIWLLALAHHAAKGSRFGFPRRLIYVVNRRTVVDQATREAERTRDALRKPELQGVAEALRTLAAVKVADPVAISTLRGQLADNAEWRIDPARPAIVLGTVDMIGSRLLFSAYGRGFKSRPLHAGFVGQDALIVHDEAHLEPAFQALLTAIEHEQKRANDFRSIRVAALTATLRDLDEPDEIFRLTDADRSNDVLARRIHAPKGIKFWPVTNQKAVAEAIADRGIAYKDSGQAILVFVRKLDDFDTIVQRLAREKCELEVLTGTMRGLERDTLAKTSDRFARFVPTPPTTAPRQGTVYLICTSAGEVGIDMSADRLVCDLTPFDSMAQRLGRVNRFGAGDASVDIVYAPGAPGKEFDIRCERTFALLTELPVRPDGRHDASPAALADLPGPSRRDAFTPEIEILATTDILLDNWSLTTIRDRMPGRPPVADWLHGIAEWQPPEAYVAWREEVGLITGDLLEQYTPEDLLDDFPLKPHELLRERVDRVLSHMKKLADQNPDAPVWVIDSSGIVKPTTMLDVAGLDDDGLADCTVVLRPHVGGLTEQGMLDGAAVFVPDHAASYDVGDRWMDEQQRPNRCRVWDDERSPDHEMQLVRTIDLRPNAVDENQNEDSHTRRYWHWYVRPRTIDNEISQLGIRQPLGVHNNLAGVYAEQLVGRLGLPAPEASAVVFAARNHDLGKNREVWQRSIWNPDLTQPLAKSGHRRPPRDLGSYRHEFGSLLDAVTCPKWLSLNEETQDLALHLIAAHHGRARPHFPTPEAFDPERSDDEAGDAARETPRRFARLQRKYGRWGLAYLESLVRAADALASSADPNSITATERASSGAGNGLMHLNSQDTIRVRVDATNPGQFFACCGLLELADRMWSGAEGWFEGNLFCLRVVRKREALDTTLPSLIAAIGEAALVAVNPNDQSASPIRIASPFELRLDWWTDKRTGGDLLKVWAGSMHNVRIARAMQHAVAEQVSWREAAFDEGVVVYDVDDPTKKVEPFYFDARRGSNARSLDIGFAPDALGITTVAYPAVEFLCLVGIQRVRPAPTALKRTFEYYTWRVPMSPIGAACAACGNLDFGVEQGYRFQVGFRTDQRKHKAFMPATRIARR
jgi:CRISPR-associated endonuclease/helicase Cas3